MQPANSNFDEASHFCAAFRFRSTDWAKSLAAVVKARTSSASASAGSKGFVNASRRNRPLAGYVAVRMGEVMGWGGQARQRITEDGMGSAITLLSAPRRPAARHRRPAPRTSGRRPETQTSRQSRRRGAQRHGPGGRASKRARETKSGLKKRGAQGAPPRPNEQCTVAGPRAPSRPH